MKSDLRSRTRNGLGALFLVGAWVLLVAGSAWMAIDGNGLDRIVGVVGLLFFGGGGLIVLLTSMGAGSTAVSWQVVDQATGRVLVTTRDRTPYAAVEALLEAGWTWDQLEVSTTGPLRGVDFHGAIPSYGSLNIARTAELAMVVAETVEYRDTIFTCPASLIRCPEARLDALVVELEAACWGEQDEASPMLWFVPYETARDVLEMDAQRLDMDGLWINPIVAANRADWPDAVRQVLEGQRDDLPGSAEPEHPPAGS